MTTRSLETQKTVETTLDRIFPDAGPAEYPVPPDEYFVEPTADRLPDGHDLLMLYAETGLSPNCFVYQLAGEACALGVLARWLGFDGTAAEMTPGPISLTQLYANITAGELGVPQSWMLAYEQGVFAANFDYQLGDGVRHDRIDDDYENQPDEHAAAIRGYDAWTTVLADQARRS